MLGLFKKFLSRASAAPPVIEAAPVAKPAPKAAPAPAAPAPKSTAPVRVLPKPAAPPVPVARPAAPPASGGNSHVKVALAAIAGSLPEALSHKVPASPEQFVDIPVDKVLPQLAQGSIQMTAAELRACAPDYFSALAGLDDVRVSLPLADVVQQLTPDQYARRPQKRIEIPAEVSSVFAAGGGGPSGIRPAPAPAAPQVRPQSTVTTTQAPQSPAPAAAAPASKISMSPQALASLRAKPSTPAAPTQAPSPVGQRPITPAPSPAPAPVTPLPSAPARPAGTPPAGSIPMPKTTGFNFQKPKGEVIVPLAQVCNDWVREVRAQLNDVDIEKANIHVPLEFLEPALKSGKPLFSWAEVASWIQPKLSSPPTPKVGEMPVELPLKVVAPLFMALHRTGNQKRADVDQTIPDLFGNGTTPPPSGQSNGHSAAPSAPAAAPFTPPARSVTPAAPANVLRMPAQPEPETQVAAQPAPTPAPAVSTPQAESPQEFRVEEVIGESGSRFSAKEIVANALRVPGVTGALLAMNDGLLVTSQTSPQVKAETVAAFLPQMFGRMNQYTKELALGQLQHLTLGVPGGQWLVIKSESIYFAVLGKPGQSLPLNLLTQVAAELSSQSN